VDEALPLAAKLTDEEHYISSVPRRRVVPCKEWEDLKLDAEELQVGGRLQVYEHISSSKYLNVRISGGMVVFTATHFVGHIPLNDHVALDVAPRFDVSNLTRLLRMAQHSPVPLEQYVRTYLVDHEHLPSIFDELTAAFVHSVETVARTGLLTSYLQSTATTSYPRGRILMDLTIRRHHARGERFRASSAWFERTVDNAPNRLLKYTMWVVERRLAAATLRKGIPKLRTKLNQYYGLFNNVRLDRSRQFLNAPDVLDPQRLPSVRSYYVQALQLAALLVREDSLDLGKHGGFITAPSMLVDLQVAFEAYLRNSLLYGLTNQGSSLEVLDGNLAQPSGAKKGLFNEEGSRRATPDIVVQQAGRKGNTRLLIEVKYKGRPSREDINQVIAYGASYKCPSVILAHARQEGEDAHLQFEGSIGSMKVYRYAYDLAGDLKTEEKLFAEKMERLALGGVP
jgi:5-methylcytosine-specific restriction enzyme subunit McrC